VGANIARQWYDQGVDVVVDVPTSSVALAISQIAREKNKLFLNSGAATSDLTGLPARPTRCIGPTTPTCWRRAPARR
jgi:branched-chain amino acid transport system substrate-binding protein